MKQKLKLALAIVAAFGLGGAVVQGLHAQAKAAPPIYLVTEIDISNVDAYMKEYAPKAQASVKNAGGRLVAASANVTTIEGQAPAKRVAIQVWDNMDKMKAWRSGTEYKDARKIGDKYAKFRTYAVEAVVTSK